MCTKRNPIIVTQSHDSLSISSVCWYHSGERKAEIFTTKIEITILAFDGKVEKKTSVSDELVERMNIMNLNE